MRRHYILLVFITFGCLLSCKDTPKNKTMQAQLNAIFPIMQGLEFDATHQEIVAHFFDGQNYTEVFFDNVTQQLLRSQHYLDFDMLPKSVRDSLITRYPDATFSQNDEIKNFDEKGKIKDTFYLMELETTTEFVHLEMRPDGSIRHETREPLSEEDQLRNEEEGVEDE